MEEWKKNLGIMWFAQLAGMGAITGVMAFLPLYVPKLGITSAEQAELWSGILMGVSSFFAALSGPYWGRLADQHGRKPMVERVMLVFFVLMIAMGFVTNVYQLLALRIIQGIFGGFTAAALALVTCITPEEQIGFCLGVFQTAMIAGSAFGPMFGGWIADTLSFQAAFISFGLLCLLSFLLIHLLVRENFVCRPAGDKTSIRSEARALFAIPGLYTIVAVQFLVQFGIQVIAPILPLFIHSLDPAAPNVATISGIIIAIAGLTSAASSAMIGRISRWLSYRSILLTGSLAAGACFAVQGFASNYWTLGLMRGVTGLFLGSMLPSVNALLTMLIPVEKRGIAFGFTTTAMQAGNVIGPLTGGIIGLYAGDTAVFVFTGIIYLFNGIWIWHKVRIQES